MRTTGVVTGLVVESDVLVDVWVVELDVLGAVDIVAVVVVVNVDVDVDVGGLVFVVVDVDEVDGVDVGTRWSMAANRSDLRVAMPSS